MILLLAVIYIVKLNPHFERLCIQARFYRLFAVRASRHLTSWSLSTNAEYSHARKTQLQTQVQSSPRKPVFKHGISFGESSSQ
jgi:hypothetical protein